MSKTRNWFLIGVTAVGGILLTACAAAPAPSAPPPARSNFYIEKEPPRPYRPKPPDNAAPTQPAIPASSSTKEPASAQSSSPGMQLPPAAQSPASNPPPAGLPHDSSQYIEPPSR